MPSKARIIKAETRKAETGKAQTQPIYGAEVYRFHTRLLRVSLALEESRAYWEQREATVHCPDQCPDQHQDQRQNSQGKQAERAFEARWFGSKSLERVRRLLADFSHRYDAYPASLNVLSGWRPSDPTTRQNICHWHLQLADPMYRAFSGDFLEQRRSQLTTHTATIDRDIAARWVRQNLEAEWATATILRMATALITCATAAGLCENIGGARVLTYPKVTDAALTYWLYFLKDLRFEGTLLSNPYFDSVGLGEGFLEPRLRQLSALKFSRMGELHELSWQYADIERWAEGELGISVPISVPTEAMT